MRSRPLLVSLVACCLFTSPLVAGDVMFHRFLGELARTDIATGQLTVVGALTRIVGSMTFGPDGRLYGLAGNPFALVEIDTSSGALTDIGNFPGLWPPPFAFPRRIAITDDGRFYMTVLPMGDGGNQSLWEIDPVTTEVTLIGHLDDDLQAFAARGNDLIGLTYTSGFAEFSLSIVSPVDASVSLMQPLNTDAYKFGDNGSVDSAGRLVTLGKPTGHHDPALIAIDFTTGDVEPVFPGLACCGYLPSHLAIREGTALEIPTLGQVGGGLLAVLLAMTALLLLRRRALP